jgi:cytosine/adenosine deaminase-related metal-dependent hydrolase
MMDMNDLYGKLKESTRESLSSTMRQAEQWHDTSGGRIRYAVAPRFVLSCSETLLREAYEMTQSFPGMLFHTHVAENRQELEAVRRRCRMDNLEFFESLGVLRPNTCLAHCIWLSETEVQLLSQRNGKVLHCPSSNMKLGSGIARITDFLARGIVVSLGADGAPCNNTLNMFQEMRLAALSQKALHGPSVLNARSVVEMATISGATALGISNETGSLEAGKKADIIMLDLGRLWNPFSNPDGDSVYASVVYSCSPENVRSVIVDGQWVYRDGCYTTLDEDRVLSGAKRELRQLLDRVE